MIIHSQEHITERLKKLKGSNMPEPLILTDSNTNDVINMRKIELLLDVLSNIDAANSPDTYGLKIMIVNKIEDLVENI